MENTFILFLFPLYVVCHGTKGKHMVRLEGFDIFGDDIYEYFDSNEIPDQGCGRHKTGNSMS